MATVTSQDEVGARQAVTHLIALGHTRIAHLTGSQQPAARHRRAAFTEIMRDLAAEFAHNDQVAAELVGACLCSASTSLASTSARRCGAAQPTG